MNDELSSRIILALDVDNFKKARYFVDLLYPEVKIFKVGSQLFTACGPQIIEYIHKKGAEVFLDLKYFDIPHTVAAAVYQAGRLKVKMLTLHILGGPTMLKSAVAVAKRQTLLIGVTVLTSQKTGPQEVLKLAKFGLSCGLDGVVCSAQEAALLRRKIRKKFIIVTPGIRPEGYKADDQTRTATAQQAREAGADFIVVGRPILEAKNPQEALKQFK
ncbi:MAG: orotidine-5'-phosphate decarboxylase [Candidatus Omnitrophica bacterium]|nr:orotidine-5'-phosphate decarboxylase [Candidatus Omnitrophota bacterium]